MSIDEVKIFFEIQQDEDDWPPVTTESIWATRVGERLYRLENVPFFAVNVSLDDIVRTELREEKEWFLEVISPSSNSTLRVFCFDDVKRERFAAWLKQVGCIWEYGFDKDYMTVNVPLSVAGDSLQATLDDLEAVEEFEYEFSCRRH